MKRETMFNLLLAFVLVLALVSGSEIVHQARAQEPAPQDVLAPQAGVSTAFTYQGRLTDDSTGNPIADMRTKTAFNVWTVLFLALIGAMAARSVFSAGVSMLHAATLPPLARANANGDYLINRLLTPRKFIQTIRRKNVQA